MSWNHLEQAGITWNEVERTGITWNKLEPPGTRWTQQQTETKNKKFIGRNYVWHTIAQ